MSVTRHCGYLLKHNKVWPVLDFSILLCAMGFFLHLPIDGDFFTCSFSIILLLPWQQFHGNHSHTLSMAVYYFCHLHGFDYSCYELSLVHGLPSIYCHAVLSQSNAPTQNHLHCAIFPQCCNVSLLYCTPSTSAVVNSVFSLRFLFCLSEPYDYPSWCLILVFSVHASGAAIFIFEWLSPSGLDRGNKPIRGKFFNTLRRMRKYIFVRIILIEREMWVYNQHRFWCRIQLVLITNKDV